MKRRALGLSLALALAFGLAAGFALAAHDGIDALDKAWEKAMHAGDAAAAAALYAPDALMYPPDAAEVKGRAEIQKNYQGFFDGMKVLETKITRAKLETLGDVAVAWGRWMVKVAPKAGGEAQVMEGRYTEVARKINGKWLFVSDHASATPQPPPPAKK